MTWLAACHVTTPRVAAKLIGAKSSRPVIGATRTRVPVASAQLEFVFQLGIVKATLFARKVVPGDRRDHSVNKSEVAITSLKNPHLLPCYQITCGTQSLGQAALALAIGGNDFALPHTNCNA